MTDNDMPEELIVSVEDEVHIVYEPDAESPYRNFKGGEAEYVRKDTLSNDDDRVQFHKKCNCLWSHDFTRVVTPCLAHAIALRDPIIENTVPMDQVRELVEAAHKVITQNMEPDIVNGRSELVHAVAIVGETLSNLQASMGDE